MNSEKVITHFVADDSESPFGEAFSPALGRALEQQEEWEKSGVQFCGFVCFDPITESPVSKYGFWYAEQILRRLPDLQTLWLARRQRSFASISPELVVYGLRRGNEGEGVGEDNLFRPAINVLA